MTKQSLPSHHHSDQNQLQEQIFILQQELNEIEQETNAFEVILRSHVSDLILEAQELFVLYKQLKKAKKQKRLEQKKKGKNYKEPVGLTTFPKKKENTFTVEQQKEKKKLYREAMLHVHPDKFSVDESDTNIATEVTTRLIEIYKTGTLETLQAYHAHIFSGNTHLSLNYEAKKIQVDSSDNYLLHEKRRLEKEIDKAKSRHLYKILHEYEKPLTFVDELKYYYKNRIEKLKKRTRKGT